MQTHSNTVTPHAYSVQNVVKGAKGKVTGELLEGDVVVATYKFNRQCWPQLVIKFGSSAAQSRFDGFSDCLTRAETIEAIGGLQGA